MKGEELILYALGIVADKLDAMQRHEPWDLGQFEEESARINFAIKNDIHYPLSAEEEALFKITRA